MKINMNFEDSTVGKFKPGEIGLIDEEIWLAINRTGDYNHTLFVKAGSEENGVSKKFSADKQCKKLLRCNLDKA